GTLVLTFEIDGSNAGRCFQNQMATTSRDGGLSWDAPVLVLAGPGCIGVDAHVRVFEEGKIAVDNDPGSPYYGRAWVGALYILCEDPQLPFCRSPIAESHSDDGGATWSSPNIVSGSNEQYCTATSDAPLCDFDVTPALPVIGPKGAVNIAFINAQNLAA